MKFNPAYSILGILLIGLMLLLPSVSAALSDNLVSYYKLDETTGTSAVDSVASNGTALNGVTTGATVNQSGKINVAYKFDGAGDFIQLPFKPVNRTARSFNLWINKTTDLDKQRIIFTDEAFFDIYVTGNYIYYNNSNSTTYVAPNIWNMLTLTYNNTHQTLYLNGVIQNVKAYDLANEVTAPLNIRIGSHSSGVESFNGTMDEIGFWNKTLTSAEVTSLYNSGSGFYPFTSTVSINLISPANSTTISDVGTIFRVTGNDISYINANWTNITYYIWNGTVEHNRTTISLNNQTFDQSLFIDEFSQNNYTWNALAGYKNSTGTYYVWGASNYTLIVVPFSVISQTYTSPIIESTSSRFAINLSFLAGYRMSNIRLIYNGTSYPSTFTEYAPQYYSAERIISVPSVNADTNYSFYWNITLESGLSEVSTTTNQTVLNIAIDHCASYTNQIYNFTMVDEDTQLPINASIGNTTTYIKVDMQFKNPTSGLTIINYSRMYNATNNARICSGASINGSTFAVDAQIEYFNTGRFIEFYNIKNYTLNTSTTNQNITLYDLNSTGGGLEFKINYKNTNFRDVPGAVIQIKRKYIDEGVFKVVELPLIGSDGYAVGHMIPVNTIYSLVVVDKGTVLDTFENIVAYCPNPTFTECTINLNSYGSAISPGSFDTQGDFSSSLTYNKTSRVITAIFTIPSGATSTIVLNATKADAVGTTLVCSDTLTASGGTLICTVPSSIGNSTIKVYLTADGIVKKSFVMSLSNSPLDSFGGNLILLGVVMMLFFVGIGVQQDPKVMGIMLVLGVIVLSALNLITSGSWIGTGATILWFIVAVVIILIKSENQR